MIIKKTGKYITPKKLGAMFYKQDNKCAYCKRKFTDVLYPTFDHKIPTYMGGHDEISNGVIACYQCNTLKGCIHPELFLYGYICVDNKGTAIKMRGPRRWYHGDLIKW